MGIEVVLAIVGIWFVTIIISILEGSVYILNFITSVLIVFMLGYLGKEYFKILGEKNE